MKYLRMPNKAQSLRLASQRQNHQNKENINPSQCTKPYSKEQTLACAIETEEQEKILRQEEVYEEQILKFLLSSVRKAPQQYNYFAKQPDITEHMRMILFNWLVDVHLKYKLHPQTFFITLNIIDTYLSANIIQRTELQLIGITALWIAAKYEETYQVPKISNLVFICDSTYNDAQILEMESKILLELKFDFLKISSLSYYQALKRFTFLKQKDYFLGRYILQGLMFNVSTRKYTELTIAASVIFLIQNLRAYQLVKQQTISEISGVSDSQLKKCAKYVYNMWINMNEINEMSSLKQKFMHSQFLQVAKVKIAEKKLK